MALDSERMVPERQESNNRGFSLRFCCSIDDHPLEALIQISTTERIKLEPRGDSLAGADQVRQKSWAIGSPTSIRLAAKPLCSDVA